jgi:hypothetical protein
LPSVQVPLVPVSLTQAAVPASWVDEKDARAASELAASLVEALNALKVMSAKAPTTTARVRTVPAEDSAPPLRSIGVPLTRAGAVHRSRR